MSPAAATRSSGLTREDFELFDGRKKVQITGFDMVDLSVVEGKATEAPVPVSARRHFLILFDLFFTPPDSVGRAKEAAADLVLQGAAPHRLRSGCDLQHPPPAGSGLHLRPQPAPAGDPLLGQCRTRRVDPRSAGPGDRRPRRRPDRRRLFRRCERDVQPPGGVPSTAASEQLQARNETCEGCRPRASRGEAASKIAALTAGMSELAAWMQSIEGRKHVVFLSEGFDSSGDRRQGQRSHRQKTGTESRRNSRRPFRRGGSWEVDQQETLRRQLRDRVR